MSFTVISALHDRVTTFSVDPWKCHINFSKTLVLPNHNSWYKLDLLRVTTYKKEIRQVTTDVEQPKFFYSFPGMRPTRNLWLLLSTFFTTAIALSANMPPAQHCKGPIQIRSWNIASAGKISALSLKVNPRILRIRSAYLYNRKYWLCQCSWFVKKKKTDVVYQVWSRKFWRLIMTTETFKYSLNPIFSLPASLD